MPEGGQPQSRRPGEAHSFIVALSLLEYLGTLYSRFQLKRSQLAQGSLGVL